MAARKKAEESELVQIEREIGLTGSLHSFVKMAWHIVEPGAEFFDGWHLGAQCEHYQAIEEEQIKTLVTNIPPGCSKSRISGVFWPVWAWLYDPSLAWGHFSFDGDNTLRQGRDSLALMRSDWFQARWGHLFSFLGGSTPAEGDYFNNRGGRRFANSVEGKATGKHFHRQVIDDPLKPKGLSKVTLDGAKTWLSNTMATRWARGSKWTARALVMQRLHEDDTSAQILAMDLNAVHLMLPMEFEGARKCIVYWKTPEHTKLTNKPAPEGEPELEVFFQDPRTEEGELLCPAFMTREIVDGLKNGELSAQEVASQLQQAPAPPGGNIFKDENFRFWISETVNKGPVATGRFEITIPPRKWIVLPSKFDLTWQSWDFAFKDTKTADFVVGQIWARVKVDFYLLWQVRDRMDFTASVHAIKKMTADFPRARKKLVEDKANGTAIMNALKGRMFGIEAIEPDGGKEARASACSPIFESGNVYFPDPDMKGFEWVRPAMAELTSFPFAKKDDVVDCTSQALNWGSVGFKSFQAAMDRMRGNNPQAEALRQLLARFR